MSKFLKSLQKTYQKLLNERSVLVNSIQTGVLMSTGDLLCQTAIEKKPWKAVQLRRTLEFSFLGVTLVGPAVSLWFKLLAQQFGHGSEAGTVLKKMACDQLIFAPGFLPVFLISVGLLHGDNREQLKLKLRKEYGKIIRTNWKIWPTVQLLNFYLMPLRYQVLFVQIVALFWNIYLSSVTQNESKDGM
ncbi:protein Mpv17-like [Anthonomus grandis grandis]|uniref:protein Mpv17-like n=1 Tax=Anthonomus grandis grandis TaxID=2921223 RepID=UPI0021660A08|nr:protein Mpv17-like [Anthonomus grandis grandis]